MPAEQPISAVVLIPAFRPSPVLVDIVQALSRYPLQAIVVVNDGSSDAFAPVFAEVAGIAKVRMLRHAVNLGKGAALKTGLNYILCEFPDSAGAVTADADGQHHPEDIWKVAERLEKEPSALVLGSRQFDTGVPARSRLGNRITRTVVRLLIGEKLTDTQTGLRGVPRALMALLLKTPSSGYDFELDMLITAKHQGYPIVQEPIRTIYEEGNRSSHFNPLVDSMKIYFVLLRFGFLSFMTAVLDNCVFYGMFRLTSNVLESQVVARAVALCFNYGLARRAVFLSDQSHRTVFPKYLALVVMSGTLSYALIEMLTATLPVKVMVAKLIAESLVFLLNFAIQRDFVFTKRATPPAGCGD